MVGIEQEEFSAPVVSTATWGYLRLHRFDYDAAMLSAWAHLLEPGPNERLSALGSQWKSARTSSSSGAESGFLCIV